MKSFFFTASVTMILFMGCSDHEVVFKLKGKVLDINTKDIIPGREIIVQALTKNNDELNTVNAGQFSTDSSGSFAFSLKKVKNCYLYNFYLVGDSTYAFSAIKLGMTELDQYGKFLTFYLDKLTDLTITLDRKSKTTGPDTLYLSWESNGIDGKILYPFRIENYGNPPDPGFNWIGGKVKSVIKTKAYADKQAIVSWRLYRNGKRKEITDTIYCKRDVNNCAILKY